MKGIDGHAPAANIRRAARPHPSLRNELRPPVKNVA